MMIQATYQQNVLKPGGGKEAIWSAIHGVEPQQQQRPDNIFIHFIFSTALS